MTNTSRTPLGSVIIPCHNAGNRLERAVASVRSQTVTDWEAIIIDDASSDNTPSIADDLALMDPRIRVIRMPKNQGAGVARSAGMNAARGRYVAFLDADDCWHPTKLERQISWMRADNWRLSCTAYARRPEEGGACVFWGVPERITRRRLLGTNVMGFSTVMYDREALGTRKMPDIRRRQDFVFLLELLNEIPTAGGLNVPLTLYHLGKDSLSASKITAARYNWYVYREHLNLPLSHSGWYFAQYAMKGVLRHRMPESAAKLGLLSAVSDSEQVTFHDWVREESALAAIGTVAAQSKTQPPAPLIRGLSSQNV